jgi:hypothetical protein
MKGGWPRSATSIGPLTVGLLLGLQKTPKAGAGGVEEAVNRTRLLAMAPALAAARSKTAGAAIADAMEPVIRDAKPSLHRIVDRARDAGVDM